MMLYGAVAWVASEASTYPFEVVRRRMQMQGGRSSTSIVFGRKALMSMANTLRSIAREEAGVCESLLRRDSDRAASRCFQAPRSDITPTRCSSCY